jgi:hypothetical protein
VALRHHPPGRAGRGEEPDQRRGPAPGRRPAGLHLRPRAGGLAAIQSQTQLNAAVELRLPTAPVPDDVALEYLEPVGERYAFVSDADAVRPLLTRRLARAADAVGDDVELLWAEESWVLATAPVESSADRLQELLADLAEVATALEQGQNAHT